MDTHAIAPLPDQPFGQLWLIDLQHEPPAPDWLACSTTEHERAARFRFERDARRYRAAHAGMRQILAQALALPPAAVHWQAGTHGKPFLPDHAGAHINLSHSGDWALFGLGAIAPIGVDIECHSDLIDPLALAAQHFTHQEQAWLHDASDADKLPLFMRIWTRKEACLKAIGAGLSIPVQAVETGVDQALSQTRIPVRGQLCHASVCHVPLPVPGATAAMAMVHAADAHLAL
jgi:4'-phosphopantetheinyl transferase